MVGKLLVLYLAAVPGRADVHGRVEEAGNIVQKLVVGGDSNLVSLDDRQGGVDEHSGLGAHTMTDPAKLQALNLAHARH